MKIEIDMKRLVIPIVIVLSSFFIFKAITHRANQGIVQDQNGVEWKLYRLQSFGMAGDYMAVYRIEGREPSS